MASRPIYGGDWASRADIARDFGIAPRAIRGRVLVAWYRTDSYEGFAVVIGAVGDRLWIVDAAHCSCRGLEGEWWPEATDAATLRRRRWWGEDRYAAMVATALDAWEAARERRAQARPV